MCGALSHVHTGCLSRRAGGLDGCLDPALVFEPPGAGSWDLDPLHFPRPVTAYWAEMHPEPFSLGYGDMTAFYGAPFGTRVSAYVNGFCYGQTQLLPPEDFPARVARESSRDGSLWHA